MATPVADELYTNPIPYEHASWRNGALSDWTIVINSNEFHTHRYVLGLGQRSSRFFYNLFHYPQPSQSLNRTVIDFGRAMLCKCQLSVCSCADPIPQRVRQVNQIASILFPNILDYMYEGTFEPSDRTVIPIMLAADFFQIDSLLAKSREFFMKVLRVDNAPELLSQCDLLNFQDELVLSQCVITVAKSFSHLSYEQLEALSPSSLIRIINDPHLQADSNWDSANFIEFFRRRYQLLTSDQVEAIFAFISRKSFNLSRDNAIFLLEKLNHFQTNNLKDETLLNMMQAHCCKKLASMFDQISDQTFWNLDPADAAAVLDCDHLHVDDEDVVLSKIISYVSFRTSLSQVEARRIWKSCRFPFVSPTMLWEANRSKHVPTDLIAVGAIIAKTIADGHPFPTDISENLAKRIFARASASFTEVPGHIVLSNKNRTVKQISAVGHVTILARQAIDCSKGADRAYNWDFEIHSPASTNVHGIYMGLAHTRLSSLTSLGLSVGGTWAIQCVSGKKVHNGISSKYGSAVSSGDIIGMSLSCQDGVGALSFSKNGSPWGVAFQGIRSFVVPAVTLYRRDQTVSISVSYSDRFDKLDRNE